MAIRSFSNMLSACFPWTIIHSSSIQSAPLACSADPTIIETASNSASNCSWFPHPSSTKYAGSQLWSIGGYGRGRRRFSSLFIAHLGCLDQSSWPLALAASAWRRRPAWARRSASGRPAAFSLFRPTGSRSCYSLVFASWSGFSGNGCCQLLPGSVVGASVMGPQIILLPQNLEPPQCPCLEIAR